MVYFHYTKNYEEFVTLMKNLDEYKNQTFIVFTGTPNETGESWCSDCVEGIIIINNTLINIMINFILKSIIFSC